MRSHPSPPLVYAHRGSSASFPELTRAAFVEALADGADGVECDVHLSSDGHLVLHHDAQLGRTSDGLGALADHTLAQLRNVDYSSWKGVAVPDTHGAAGEQFMTLDELLDLLLAAGRPVGLAVEMKHPSPRGRGLEDALLALLERRGWDPRTGRLGTVLVSLMSFDADAVSHLLERAAPAVVCQLVDENSGERERENLSGRAASTSSPVPAAQLPLAGPGIGFVRAHITEVEGWLRDGSVLRVWTVDTREDTFACLALGIKQITTNVPRLVRAWLAEGEATGVHGCGTLASATQVPGAL